MEALREDDLDEFAALDVAVYGERREARLKSLEIARAAKRRKREVTATARLEGRVRHLESNAALVADCFPSVAKACGVELGIQCRQGCGVLDAGVGPYRRACGQVWRLFTRPSTEPRSESLGASWRSHCRAATAAVGAIEKHTRASFDGLLGSLARLRSKGASVIIGYRHEWDETRQRVVNPFHRLMAAGSRERWQQVQEMLREKVQASQNSTSMNIMVQSGTLSVKVLFPMPSASTRDAGAASQEAATDEDLARTLVASTPWLVKPLGLSGTAAPEILAGLRRGLLVDVMDQALMDKLRDAADTFLFATAADRASSNLVVARHFQSLVDDLPPFAYSEQTWCLLHIVQGMKTHSREYTKMVGKFFSFANGMRQSTEVAELVSRLDTFVRSKLRRRCAPPPTKWEGELRRVVAAVFSVEQPCNERRREHGSSLLQDLEHLLLLDNGDPFNVDVIDHWCWHGPTGQPCCRSEAAGARWRK